MKRQVIILTLIYFIVMILGAFWCQFNFSDGLDHLIINSLIFVVCSYGLFIILKGLEMIGVLDKLVTKFKFIMTYINYIYLLLFLIEAMIGLVMVFVFKEYLYADRFLAVLTILHATSLTKDLLERYHLY
ncbi:MAG: hypothetical protein ACLRT4_10040 [Thomasclavelia sp.]